MVGQFSMHEGMLKRVKYFPGGRLTLNLAGNVTEFLLIIPSVTLVGILAITESFSYTVNITLIVWYSFFVR